MPSIRSDILTDLSWTILALPLIEKRFGSLSSSLTGSDTSVQGLYEFARDENAPFRGSLVVCACSAEDSYPGRVAAFLLPQDASNNMQNTVTAAAVVLTMYLFISYYSKKYVRCVTFFLIASLSGARFSASFQNSTASLWSPVMK